MSRPSVIDDPTAEDMLKVVAVVVTYNRCECLLKNLAALGQQTRPVDLVVVLDNCSTDGTAEALGAAGYFELPWFDYVRLDHNGGGAGGFHAGMEYAMKLDPDWLWVMDDDVAPEPDCLEGLLSCTDRSEAVHPKRIGLDGHEFAWEHYLDVLTGGRTHIGNRSFRNGKEMVFTNVACFEGMLVSARIVTEIGTPDEKYFISDDDTLFGVKASVHTNVAYVSKAAMRRLLPVAPTAPWKTYYEVRNRFFLLRDVCDYLDIAPTGPQLVLFYVAQVIEALRSIKCGRRHLRPAVSGFRAGHRYLRDWTERDQRPSMVPLRTGSPPPEPGHREPGI